MRDKRVNNEEDLKIELNLMASVVDCTPFNFSI